MTPKTEPTDERALTVARTNPYALDTNLAPVDWRAMRERFDPQGIQIPAKELVGETFTIVMYRPVESSYEGGGVFYYCRCLKEDTGEIFNTTLGGAAVVEVLDAFDRLRNAYHEAVSMGDSVRALELADMGAVAPLRVTLDFVTQGKYNGYYVFE